LNNFLVGLTNISPNSTTYMYSTLCGQWPGIAPKGKTMFLQCHMDSATTAFQYVIIRGFAAAMAVCELEVYAAGRPIHLLLRK
jgi:hypothetical protein